MDQWLVAKGEPLRGLVADLTAFLERYEADNFPRVRRRKSPDQTNFEAIIHVIVANLAYAVLFPSATGRLAINAGNRTTALTRFDNRALGKQFMPVVRLMENAGLLNLHYPQTTPAKRGEKASIAPSQLAERMEGCGITAADFGRHPKEEVVILTRLSGTRADPKRERVDYKDTDQTNAIRDEVRRINAFLEQADIAFVGDGLLPRVDAFSRTLTRRFNVGEKDPIRFDKGGRLFGGFWINLASGRRHGIRIQGEPIADLDYKNMFARLAYAEIGVEPPEGDLYAIDGLEDYRSGVKMAFNVFLWDPSRKRQKWPHRADGARDGAPDLMGVGLGSDADAQHDPSGPAAAVEARLPAGWEDPKRLREALLRRHPALKDAFGRALGYGLMFKESAILLAVLNELMAKGIVSLPLHDGLMVARSRASEVKDIMEAVGEEKARCRMPVVCK